LGEQLTHEQGVARNACSPDAVAHGVDGIATPVHTIKANAIVGRVIGTPWREASTT